MAVMIYHRPVDASFLMMFNGVATDVRFESSTSIRVDYGAYSASLGGSFNAYGGRATSMTFLYEETPYLTISDFSISATNASAAARLLNGNDRVIGSSGNDTFFVSMGNDEYNGGEGLDTILIDVPRSYATVVASGTGYLLKDRVKTDALNGVERLSFVDGTLALDVKAGETSGSVYRLYQAAFDRKPDTAGLKYWVDQVDQGASMAQVALGFVQSNEFRQLNPSGDTHSMLNNYYKNVLHREADATGLAYWTNAAANGQSSHDILAAFAESHENLANTAAATQNGIWLG